MKVRFSLSHSLAYLREVFEVTMTLSGTLLGDVVTGDIRRIKES